MKRNKFSVWFVGYSEPGRPAQIIRDCQFVVVGEITIKIGDLDGYVKKHMMKWIAPPAPKRDIDLINKTIILGLL